jgi:hypothetical protein
LVGGFGGRESALVEGFENMADKGEAVTMKELLILFINGDYGTTQPQRPVFSSASATLRLPQRLAVGAIAVALLVRNFLLCYLQKIPALLHPRQDEVSGKVQVDGPRWKRARGYGFRVDRHLPTFKMRL